jgi:LysR family transcriptional regulator, low CO2-responsive transcriptional regulator
MLDTSDLYAFIAFSETKSFTQAAKQIGLSQPALFEKIKRLSEELQVPLYEKIGKELRLTEHGRRFCAFARDSLERSQEFVKHLRGESKEEIAILAAGEGAFLYLLGKAISRFRQKEKATLRLLTLGGPSALRSVLEGSAHLAVGVVDLLPAEIEAKELIRTPLCVAFMKGHPFEKKRYVKLRELSEERFILPPPGRSHRDFVGRALSSIGQEIKTPLEADGWPLMLKFASLGLGVAIVNGVCELPKGVLTRPVPELGFVTYRLFSRRGAHLPPCAARLASYVLEAR